MEWNIIHLNQAHAPPLTTKHWQRKLDPVGKTDDELEDIINCTLLDGEELSPETVCLREQIFLNLQSMMDSMRKTITQEHFCSFKKRLQRTSLPPPQAYTWGTTRGLLLMLPSLLYCGES